MARRATRGLAAAAALVLALVACGGDDGDTADTVDETTTEAADATTTEASEPAGEDEPGDTEPAEDETTTEPETTTTVAGGLTEDEAQAIPDQVDLTLEDVTEYDPSFVEDPGDDEDAEDDGFDDCFGEVEDLETIAEGDGRAFEADLAYTASATTVMARDDDAIAAVDSFGSEPFRACFESYFSQDGLTAQIDSYPSGARFGDQWAILAGTLEAEGQTFGVELHVVRTGPVLTLFMYLDLGDSGEATAYVVDGLLTLIDERQAAAVG